MVHRLKLTTQIIKLLTILHLHNNIRIHLPITTHHLNNTNNRLLNNTITTHCKSEVISFIYHYEFSIRQTCYISISIPIQNRIFKTKSLCFRNQIIRIIRIIAHIENLDTRHHKPTILLHLTQHQLIMDNIILFIFNH